MCYMDVCGVCVCRLWGVFVRSPGKSPQRFPFLSRTSGVAISAAEQMESWSMVLVRKQPRPCIQGCFLDAASRLTGFRPGPSCPQSWLHWQKFPPSLGFLVQARYVGLSGTLVVPVPWSLSFLCATRGCEGPRWEIPAFLSTHPSHCLPAGQLLGAEAAHTHPCMCTHIHKHPPSPGPCCGYPQGDPHGHFLDHHLLPGHLGHHR